MFEKISPQKSDKELVEEYLVTRALARRPDPHRPSRPSFCRFSCQASPLLVVSYPSALIDFVFGLADPFLGPRLVHKREENFPHVLEGQLSARLGSLSLGSFQSSLEGLSSKVGLASFESFWSKFDSEGA